MVKIARGALQTVVGVGLLCFLGISSSASELPQTEWNLETLARTHPNPESIARFLRDGVTPADDQDLFDRAEYWQTPEEFLMRRRGDCEDYALFSQALLARLGFEAFVFSLYGEGGYAHTVTVFKEKGRYQVLNQDRLIRFNAKTLEELASWIYPPWTWGAVVTRSGAQGRIIREIFKPLAGSPFLASRLIERSA